MKGEYVIVEKNELNQFGKNIKKRLIDLDINQSQLIQMVKKKTGLYFDGSYLYKIMTGRLNTPGIIQAICEILDIEMSTE